MTTADRKGAGPTDECINQQRAAAKDRAHWLVKEVQDCVPGRGRRGDRLARAGAELGMAGGPREPRSTQMRWPPSSQTTASSGKRWTPSDSTPSWTANP